MKKNLLFVLLLAGFLVFPKLSHADTVNNFNDSIKINSDSSIDVTETIVYDFIADQNGVATPHHGIDRYIPYSYQARGGNYNLNINVTSVTDQTGSADMYQVSSSSGTLHIRIGDPNELVNGINTYVIHYTVQGAINYFNDHDELYWNVTGNGWGEPITNAGATVQLPGSVDLSKNVQQTCYAGDVGSTTLCDKKDVEGNQFVFNQGELSLEQGLTIVVGFPKGVVVKPTTWQIFLKTITDNPVVGLPLLVLIVMFFVWYKKGRDPVGNSVVMAEYEAPKDLSPSESGTILKEKVDSKYISAEIINLAVAGYLKITRLEEKIFGLIKHADYQLDLIKKADDGLSGFQKKLVADLFSGSETIKISQLKNTFYVHIKELSNTVMSGLVQKEYFPEDPNKVRTIYNLIGAVFIFIGGFTGKLSALPFNTGSIYFILSFIVSGAIIICFAFIMPRRTTKGNEARQYILGLKLYLSMAEKDRLKFTDAPEANPQRFEKLLPYAMVLGVENEWAQQFNGIYNQPPVWYNDPYGGTFNSILLVSSLNNFSMATNTMVVSTPRGAAGGGSGFGGGGFSGGGFGGGGGGSW